MTLQISENVKPATPKSRQAEDTGKKKRNAGESTGSRAKVSEVINMQLNQYIGPVDQIQHMGHFYGPSFGQMPFPYQGGKGMPQPYCMHPMHMYHPQMFYQAQQYAALQ